MTQYATDGTAITGGGGGGGTAVGSLLYSQSSVEAGDTVASSVAETTFASNLTSFDASQLVAGDVLRFRFAGVWGATGTPTHRFRLKFGSTTLADTGTNNYPAATNQGWVVDIVAIVKTAGAAGVLEVQGQATYKYSGADFLLAMANTATVSVDLSATADFDFTTQWGTSHASNTITQRQATVELLTGTFGVLAEDVTYDNDDSTLAATTTQAAIDELAWDWKPPLAASLPDGYSGDAGSLTLADDANVGLIATGSLNSAGNIQRLKMKSLPSSGAADWTVTIKARWTWPATSAGSFNLTIYEVATGKVAHIGWLSGANIHAWRSPNLTSFTTNIGTAFARSISAGYWLRIVYTHGTTTYDFQYSADGKNWQTMGSVGAATAFTTRADKVGIAIQTASTGQTAYMSVPYWSQSF